MTENMTENTTEKSHYKMTPKERAEALSRGAEVDRLPCTPMITDHAATLIDANGYDYLHSSELMAKAHIKAFEIYGHDSVGLNPEVIGLPEAMGSEVKYFKYGRGQISEPLIRNFSDIKKLGIINPEKDGRLPLYFDALKIIRHEIGDKVRVATGIGGPFTTAGIIRGMDTFLMDTIKNPQFVHQLMEITTANVIAYMRKAFELGFSCSLGEPMGSCNVISPTQFRKFVKPYLKEISDFSKNMQGKGPSVHICGKTEKYGLIWLK